MGDLKESVNLRGFTVRMISTGLKAEKKGPAEKEKTDDVREENYDCQSPSQESGWVLHQPIGQHLL